MAEQTLDVKYLNSFYELLCPWILANDFVKKIISLQMFSNPTAREKFHVLLCGNVATSKSEMLDEISQVMPNSVYISKRVTYVGIEEKIMAANSGLVCVDELDKIDKHIRWQLLDVMSTQQVVIDKMGFHVKYACFVNILGACNPKNFRLDEGIPIHMQLPFDMPFLSRWHLIVPVFELNPELYGEAAVKKEFDFDKYDVVKKAMMKSLMDVRRTAPIVNMSDKIARMCGDYICELKQLSPMKTIITPRGFEGMMSAVKARSRQNLRSYATEEDFKFVKKIYDKIYIGF